MLKITKNQGSIQVTADKSGFYPFDGTIIFPTNSLFTATSANTDMITFKSTSNGDVQFVGNYKDITISGRSYDTKQKFLTAFSNLANQGSVDAYTKAETDAKIDAKQNKLKAGNGITLTEDATDGTTVVKTAVSLTDNGNGAYQVGSSIKMGSDTVTIGRSAASRSEWSIAIGKGATSGSGTTNVAIGNIANSSGGSSIAIGDKTETSNFSAIAIGTSTGAYLPYSIAIGYNAKAVTNKPLVINAGNKTVLQSDATGKLSILKGDGTDERIVIQDALSAGGSGGTVDAYTRTETDNLLNAKQNTLTAGTGITIDENNVISSTGGSGGSANPYVNVKGTDSATIPDNVIEAVAIGSGARTSSGRSVAIGYKAETSAGTPMVINASSKTMIQGDATGKISILKGDGTDERMVIQDEIEALKNAGGSGGTVDGLVIDGYKVAVGLYQTSYTNRSSVVIGNEVEAYNDYSVLIGQGVKGRCDDAVVIGRRAETTTNSAVGSVVIGTEAKSSTEYGLSIGQSAEANDTKPLVINAGVNGNMRLTMIQGDANGKISILKGDGSDERMVIQDEIEALKNAGGSGGGGSANPYVNVKGVNESATIADDVTFGIAIGERTNVTKDAGIAIGDQSQAKGRYCVSVGRLSTSMGDSTVAVGDNAKSMMNKAIAIGSGAIAMSKNAIAIGPGANATSNMPLVIKASDNGLGAALPMIQGDKVGKISIPLGDGTLSTMCLQDEIAALKAEIAALKGGASTDGFVDAK